MLPYFMDAYLVGVLDPISQGENRSQVDCNSPGLSQYGAQRWAIGNSDAGADPTSPNFPRLNYMQILTHYYTGIHILDDNQAGAAITPQRRWVPLTVHWQAPYEQGEIMYRGQTYTVTFQIQNTGTITWNDITLTYFWHHGWDKNRSQRLREQTDITTIYPVTPGVVITDTLTVMPPSVGRTHTAYKRRFEMGYVVDYENWVGFSELEAERPWFTYDIVVCIDGPCQVFLPLVLKGYSH